MSGHTYWRLDIKRNNGSSFTSIGEIEMHTSIGGADQCSGGTASASGDTGSAENADKAFDNSGATQWAVQQAAGVWIMYQFASPVDIVEYVVTNRSGGFNTQPPNSWILEFSDDGITWGYADAREGLTWTTSEVKTFTVPTVTDIYRIEIESINGGSLMELDEVEMRLTSGGADQCTGGFSSASEIFSTSFNPSKAVDNSTSTQWASVSASNQWWQYHFASSVTIVEYTISARSTNLNQMPRNWRLRHSTDKGVTWTDVDDRWQQSWSASETKTFTVGQASASQGRLSQVVVEVLRPNVAAAGSARPVVVIMT